MEETIAEIATRDTPNPDQREANCVFIAHARTDIPDLLKEIARLRWHLQIIATCCHNARPESYDPGAFPLEIEKMVSIALSAP